MTDGQPPVVDMGVVNALRESVGDDDDFVRELVETYIGEGRGHLDALAEAAAKGDPAEAVRPSHTLKSSSASVGAMRLSELCRSIEAASREGVIDGLSERVATVRETWAATVEAFRREGLAS